MTEWDKNYLDLTPLSQPEPEPIHWGYKLLAVALGMVLVSWLGSWFMVEVLL